MLFGVYTIKIIGRKDNSQGPRYDFLFGEARVNWLNVIQRNGIDNR